jgi:hypothetical protein
MDDCGRSSICRRLLKYGDIAVSRLIPQVSPKAINDGQVHGSPSIAYDRAKTSRKYLAFSTLQNCKSKVGIAAI